MRKPCKRIDIVVDDITYNQIKDISEKRHCSMSEVGRSYIQDGLNGDITKSNIDFVAGIIREQLKIILYPSVERLAALSAKTCMQASTSAYLNAEALARFVPLNQQMELEQAYNAARKKAALYLKRRLDDSDLEET